MNKDFVVRVAEDCALQMLPYFVRPKADNEGPVAGKKRRAQTRGLLDKMSW